MEKESFASTIKKRLPQALISGFTTGFLFCFFGVLSIFANNRNELLFNVGEFLGTSVLISLIVSAVLALIILFAPGRVSDIIFGTVTGITVAAYIQSLLLNGSGALSGDNEMKVDTFKIIFDIIIWVVVIAGCIFASIIMKKHSIAKSILIIFSVIILVMEITGVLMQINNITRDSMSVIADNDDPEISDISKGYLTDAGINEVSKGKNTIVFVIDRFDVAYVQTTLDKDPEFFDRLDGFTCYRDNISLYSRTYPGICTMVTGIDTDFKMTMSDYFNKAYSESPFLKDLKKNNYKIKLYTASYYAYADGRSLFGVADNFSVASEYTVTDRPLLIQAMYLLSAYRYLPDFLKTTINVSTSSFRGLIDYEGTGSLYELDDAKTIADFRESGLTTDNSENEYTLIHLSGCHDPCEIDENGYKAEVSYAEDSVRGCFKYIFEYIDELKRLGVYDNSTIIITGDHPRAMDDAAVPSTSRVTALFVKEAGSSGSFRYSMAQVSQENLIPTIVKSSGLKTENDYGKAYSEISETETTTRYHKFEMYVGGDVGNQIVTFEIKGHGMSFGSWELYNITEIGDIYN